MAAPTLPDTDFISKTRYQFQFIDKAIASLTEADSPVTNFLMVPKGAYNNFVKTWSADPANRARAWPMLQQYNQVLTGAAPDVRAELYPPVQGPSNQPSGTATPTQADVDYYTQLENAANKLKGAFPEYVKTQGNYDEIAAFMRQIGNMIITDPSAGAMSEVRIPRGTWQTFIKFFNDKKLDSASEVLGQFCTQVQSARTQVAHLVNG